jgi:hypothetical protein
MLHTRLQEISRKGLTTASIASSLVAIMLILSLLISYAPNASEAATTAKLDKLYSTNFSSIPFPSFLVFDPFEEYRHVVFDRTVTIMGHVLLNDTDNFTDKVGDGSTTSQQVHESSRVQLSEQPPTNNEILTRHRLQSPIEREERWRGQFDVAKQGSSLGPPYVAPKIASLEANNQDKIVSKSQWFPSVPSYFCDGEYSFVIEGTANLDLDKLKKADQYKVTIKILTDKLGLTSPDDHKGITGVLDISSDEHLKDKNVERGNGISENTRAGDSSLTTHNLTLASNNLNIEEIKNSCRVHMYNTR